MLSCADASRATSRAWLEATDVDDPWHGEPQPAARQATAHRRDDSWSGMLQRSTMPRRFGCACRGIGREAPCRGRRRRSGRRFGRISPCRCEAASRTVTAASTTAGGNAGGDGDGRGRCERAGVAAPEARRRYAASASAPAPAVCCCRSRCSWFSSSPSATATEASATTPTSRRRDRGRCGSPALVANRTDDRHVCRSMSSTTTRCIEPVCGSPRPATTSVLPASRTSRTCDR